MFDLEEEPVKSIDYLVSIRDEGIDKKYISEEEKTKINNHIESIKLYK